MKDIRREVQEIYCDESGFTGNNLLDQATPFFSYATIAISHSEAQKFVREIISKYKIQNNELKFQKLVRYNRGRKAITEVLKTFSSRAKVSVYHKKFSLACKFFEYVFEPTIAANNSLFYNIGFHKFIAHILYVHFEAKSEYAENIFESFLKMMKEMDDEGLAKVFSQTDSLDSSPALSLIKEFCIHQRAAINSELDSLRGSVAGRWVLDLSDSALSSLLAEWGQEHSQLQVFCDTSKPINENIRLYSPMVGNKSNLSIEVAGEEYPLTYNLADVPQMVDSKSYSGIQIADIFAGASTFVLKQGSKSHHDYPDIWTQYILDCCSYRSVLPDFDCLDFNDVEFQRNYILLHELTQRSLRGASLLYGIDSFIENLTQHLSLESNRFRI